jgi:hypothetical protein
MLEPVKAPTFRASASEQLTIKRFLDFALKDIEFQAQGMLAEMIPGAFNNAETTAIRGQASILTSYVKALRAGVDEMTKADTEH